MQPMGDGNSAIQLADMDRPGDDRIGRPPRRDGRKQLLVYVMPEVIKNAKRAALDDDTTVSAIVETVLREWLDKRQAQGVNAGGTDQ